MNLPYFMIHRIEFNRFNNGSIQAKTHKTDFAQSKVYGVYSWLRMTIVQIIPLVFLCIFNTLLIIIMYQHNKKIDKKSDLEHIGTKPSLDNEIINGSGQGEPNATESILDAKETRVAQQRHISAHLKKRNAQRKLNILLIAVILLNLFGAIPQAFSYVRIFEAFGACKGAFHYCPTYVIYRMVTTNIALISYSVTFFLYLFLNRHFREELAKCMRLD